MHGYKKKKKKFDFVLIVIVKRYTLGFYFEYLFKKTIFESKSYITTIRGNNLTSSQLQSHCESTSTKTIPQ